MSYISARLARITPGEIGPDQAVIDYFYYAPEVTIAEIMSKGFFDAAGYLFYTDKTPWTYQRIHIYAQRGYGTPVSSEIPVKYSAIVSDVVAVGGPEQNPTAFEVTLALGPDTSYQHDDTLPPPQPPVAWQNLFIKYQGILRYNSNTAPGTDKIINIPSNYEYSPNDFAVTNLLARDGATPALPNPVAGDAVVASYVQAGTNPGYPIRLRLILAGSGSGSVQRVWVTIYSSICQFV